jgi:hypothetical protein
LSFLIEIEVSRPSVTLRKRQQLKAFKGVTLHRDTSKALRQIEVSRQVWTSLVNPLAGALPTTTPALDGRRVMTLVAVKAQGPALGPFGGAGDSVDDMGPTT